MRLRRLESRIVALFLVLIVALQMGSFFAIQTGIQKNARSAIADQLLIGERVFLRLLDQNAQKLTQGARLLAADYGFRESIGSDDRETIASALANHGARIGASLTMLVGTDRQIKAATPTNPSAGLANSIMQMVALAEQNGSATDTTLVDNLPFQIVIVPVKAPVIIGWVVMAFPVDQRLAADMQALSSLQVTILAKNADGSWAPGVSTLPAQEARMLAEALRLSPGKPGMLPNILIADSQYSARVLSLSEDASHTAIVVLQRSVSEAIAPYRSLQITLLVLTIIGLLLAVIGSVVTAKRITGPLRQLAETARRLGMGDYAAPIEIKRDDEIGALSQAFGNMRDGLAKRELEITRLAYWDTLTDLPNRAQFTNLLQKAIIDAATSNETCFVLMMDLDRFKHVNDVLGHSYGDKLLRKLSARLTLQLRGERDLVARLGGDEFAFLLHNATLQDAQTVAARILAALETPISLEDQTVDMGLGIGIAGYPSHGSDPETLLSHAEVAMYTAKQRSNGAVVYDPAVDQGSQQSLSLLSELRQAVEHNEFRLHVQPKVSLDTGKVVGFESLVRWVHPERGNIFPDDFIPFAEKTGFIRTLTRWVLEQSAVLCHALHAKGVFLKVSVNLSTRDLLDQDLPAKLGDILLRNGVEASSFCLEITESAIMDDPVRAQLTLEKLHAMGVELSIDDFGTGYSSLAYLKRLPVDELKIDKSFVMNMALDADDTKIVRSTIDLGHNMGLRVVAEGIENAAVWQLLKELGCDQGQGYFMSRPLPGDQLLDWMAKWQAPVTPVTPVTPVAAAGDALDLGLSIDDFKGV